MFTFIKLQCCVFLFLLFSPLEDHLPGGLKFSGGEQIINRRTSYRVFGNKTPEFSENLDIEFKLSLYPEKQIGYLLRIKDEKNNRIFNLFFDGQGNDLSFRFNEEGKRNLIAANMGKEELLNLEWFKMRISFDLKSDSIKLTIHNKTFRSGKIGLPDSYYPVVLFGKSDHIIDVPSFAIKDLSVGGEGRYFFPLKENEGSIVHDRSGHAVGEVVNPEWLINDAYHWRHEVSYRSKAVAGANYNPQKKEIYYFSEDSLRIFHVKSGDTEIKTFEEKCPVNLVLGTNFIDPEQDKLYSYEIFYENPYEGFTVASLDLNTWQWTGESRHQLPRQLHHHGSYYDPSTRKYTLFGGFGSMHYNNNFLSYDLNTREWDTLNGFSGDFLSPRYFASVGYLKKTNSIYVYGGMGNESGEQSVGRKYYYDLYQVDLDTKHISKRWEIPWEQDNMVPVRGMVILDDSVFYTLCYPEHFSESFLKLYRFSLADGSYEVLGDSIPIYSDKIATNANLYYDRALNSLFAVVQEFDDDISSDLKVYSLAFPPVTAEELVSYSRGKGNKLFIWTIVGSIAVFAAGAGYLLKRRRMEQAKDPVGITPPRKGVGKEKVPLKPNAVYLFGDFMVRDRNNKDITYMFSAKLKQVFCLILQYSEEDEGITSQRLGDILWPDKPADKVKNSRGVTMNHLRKVLVELDGIELIYERGNFKFIQTSPFYCDYTRCLEIISLPGDPDERRMELLGILCRGKFLNLTDDPSFDSFKQATEQKLEPVLLLETEKSFGYEDWQETIGFAESVFHIDPLNESALAFQIKAMQKLKMNDEARIRYQAFAMEYKKVIGKDYPHYLKV